MRGAILAMVALIAAMPPSAIGQCETQKLTASDADPNDAYGFSVGAAGSTVVIGAFQHDGETSNTGAAYVYTSAGGVWGDEVVLTALDAMMSDTFGASVAIDGDVIVCGAPGVDDLGSNAGAVYVFRRINSIWTFEARLQASDGTVGARFGDRVSVSGDAVLIGAPNHPVDGPGSGAAYVFRRSGSEWNEEAKLPATYVGGAFGSSTAIDGDVAIVGAPDRLPAFAIVYRFNGTTWEADPGPLLSDDLSSDTLFGSTADIEGDLAIVGARDESDKDGAPDGAAYVFRFDGAEWIRELKLTPPDREPGGGFGSAVALDGANALVGARAALGTGAAYLYDTTTWEHLARLTASDAEDGDLFGAALALDGDVIIVGAYKSDDAGNASGSAYTYATRGPDCNDNGRGDCLDIALGSSDDCNGDGRPDECLVSTGLASTAGRLTIHVPDDYPTIQAALDVAEDGDEVVVANGVYSGEGNFNLDFDGKAVVLRSEDCDPARCIIDCAYFGRGFVFTSGETAATQVSGFTIMNGRVNGDGGGIFVDGGSPTITNCTILLCNAFGNSGYGGGLYCSYGNPTLINCVFHSNEVSVNNGTGGGAAIRMGQAAITGCVFIANTAGYDGALSLVAGGPTTLRDCLFLANRGTRSQGGVFADNVSSLRLLNCTFDFNITSLYAGALMVVGTDPVIERCTFRDNSAGGSGGAIINSTSSPVLSECSFMGNTSGRFGGAIVNEGGSNPELLGCVFENNTTAGDGGGMYTLDSAPIISGCLFRDNAAIRGGGLFSEAAALPSVRDSRFCANDPTNIEGPYTDEGGNVISAQCTGPCPADVNGDSVVDVGDIVAVLAQWGPCPENGPCTADVNDDGGVDVADIVAIVGAWGPCPPELARVLTREKRSGTSAS